MNRKAFDTEKHTMESLAKTVLAALAGMAVALAAHADGMLEIEALQRYPWNGMVDLECHVSNPYGASIQSFTATDEASGTSFPVKTLWDANGTMLEEGYDLPAGDIHLFWNAAADLPKDWKSERMTLTGNIRNYQTVTFGTPTYSSDGIQAFLSASALSGNEMTFEVVSGPGVVEGNVLTFTGPEQVTVRVTAENEDWMPASATNTFAALYAVLDLSAGSSASQYPVTYLAAAPSDGFNTDTYKTTKLALRRIEAGTFTMGAPSSEVGCYSPGTEMQHSVTLTKAFYIGVFEVTQNQWQLVMGNNPSEYEGDMRPVDQVEYGMVRGGDWPTTSAVGTGSFMGVLRSRTGVTSWDLPTEAQWEYACRAGTTTALNSGKDLTSSGGCPNLDELGRYWADGGASEKRSVKVGSYLPNSWGLYDMHGNVCEWCLDGWQQVLGRDAVTDPVGISSDYRVVRGGSWSVWSRDCRSASREGFRTVSGWQINMVGFRLALHLSE